MAKRKWLILAVVVAVAGVFVALGLNRDTQVQHFTAKVERGDMTSWRPPEPSTP
jgi:hypothetical protein